MDWFLYDKELRHERIQCSVAVITKFGQLVASEKLIDLRLIYHTHSYGVVIVSLNDSEELS